MDTNHTQGLQGGRWMALLLFDPTPAPPTPPRPAPLPSPAFWEGDCPACGRIVRLWLGGRPARTDRHDPGCRLWANGEGLRAALGLDR